MTHIYEFLDSCIKQISLGVSKSIGCTSECSSLKYPCFEITNFECDANVNSCGEIYDHQKIKFGIKILNDHRYRKWMK